MVVIDQVPLGDGVQIPLSPHTLSTFKDSEVCRSLDNNLNLRTNLSMLRGNHSSSIEWTCGTGNELSVSLPNLFNLSPVLKEISSERNDNPVCSEQFSHSQEHTMPFKSCNVQTEDKCSFPKATLINKENNLETKAEASGDGSIVSPGANGCMQDLVCIGTSEDNIENGGPLELPLHSKLANMGELQDATDCDIEDAMMRELVITKNTEGSAKSSPANTLDSLNSSLEPYDASRTHFSSSFSSIISTDNEVCVTSLDITDSFADSTSINASSGPHLERSVSLTSQDSGIDLNGRQPKTKKVPSFTEFLSRSLFFRKNRESFTRASIGKVGPPPVWKLFTKQTDERAQGNCDELTSSQTEVQNATKTTTQVLRKDIQVSSTTALILQPRPKGLPDKHPEEEQYHQQLFQKIILDAKKKEQKDAKMKQKQLDEQLRHEECVSNAVQIWKKEILPNWEVTKSTRKAKELLWFGIPSCVRGKVWKLAIGNDLNLTKDLYHICLSRAKQRLKLLEDWGGDTDSISSHMSGLSAHSISRESSVELIQLDVFRTFPQLGIFQKGGPYHELLHGLLGAYVCYRPDIGYVQGMSFIAAVLLLNLEVDDTFIVFANLLNRPCQMAFFRLEEPVMKAYFNAYEVIFGENLPRLHHLLDSFQLTPDLYIIDWMFTLYAKSLPLDVASRVWDVFCCDGEEFLFRTALGILLLYEDVLLQMDFIHVAQFLTRLPEDISCEELFKCINQIRMSVDGRCFREILNANLENRDVE